MTVLFRTGLLVLFSTMSVAAPQIPLKAKIGQMIMLGFDERSVTRSSEIVGYIKQYHIGGVIFSPDDMLAMGKDKTPFTMQEIAQISKTLQRVNRQSELKDHLPELPLFIATDEEGGRIDRFRTVEDTEPTLPASLYPSLSSQKRQHELHKISRTLKRTGFNLNFAPVLDINSNPRNPIVGRLERSYSANPEQVVELAQQFSQALREQKILCTYKHFPGHGSSDGDSHLGFVEVTRTWKSSELFPYQVLLKRPNACQIIMTAHVVNQQLDPSGMPATLSYSIVTKMLKNHLNFNGVVISDDMQMQAIRDHYSAQEAATLAINAGVDVLLYAERKQFPLKNPGKLIELIAAQVKRGVIPQRRIDEAYRRIVNLKKTLLTATR